MHSAACGAKIGFGHECDGFAFTKRQVFRQVFDHQGAIGGFENILEGRFYLTMPGTTGFVMMIFNLVTEFFHHQ